MPPSDQKEIARPEGIRDRKKADKLRRIEQAARHLFAEKGYEETTIREIAARAEVGFGTIFSYVADKAELTFLIRNNDVEAMLAEALPRARAAASLSEQVLIVCEGVFRLFLGQDALSRVMLKEMPLQHGGVQGQRFAQMRGSIRAHFQECIAEAQQAGRLRSPEDPVLLAETVFAVLSWELRRWTGTETLTDIEVGLAHLRRMMQVVLDGLGPIA